MVFRKEDQKIAVGSPVELSTKDYAEKLMKLEEGTILVHYTSTSDQAIQSLFSVSNAKQDMKTDIFMFISDLKEYLAAKSEMRAR